MIGYFAGVATVIVIGMITHCVKQYKKQKSDDQLLMAIYKIVAEKGYNDDPYDGF